MVYLSYKKSSNNRENLQHYSQDVNYYETVKKVHKKVIKNFYHLTTCTLPVYGHQMNRASLKLGVHGSDESYSLHGCEIVGWVSEKSGCRWFPVIVMSIN